MLFYHLFTCIPSEKKSVILIFPPLNIMYLFLPSLLLRFSSLSLALSNLITMCFFIFLELYFSEILGSTGRQFFKLTSSIFFFLTLSTLPQKDSNYKCIRSLKLFPQSTGGFPHSLKILSSLHFELFLPLYLLVH